MSIEESIGLHVERLGVEVLDGVACYVAGSQYSIPRLKEHYGKDLCWHVAVPNKRGTNGLTVCPCKGSLHQVDGDKKGAFITNTKHFRLKPGESGYRKSTAFSDQGSGQP